MSLVAFGVMKLNGPCVRPPDPRQTRLKAGRGSCSRCNCSSHHRKMRRDCAGPDTHQHRSSPYCRRVCVPCSRAIRGPREKAGWRDDWCWRCGRGTDGRRYRRTQVISRFQPDVVGFAGMIVVVAKIIFAIRGLGQKAVELGKIRAALDRRPRHSETDLDRPDQDLAE